MLKSAGLTDQELERLLGFIGYGRLEAPVWFLGMEEAGGGEENLRARLEFEPVEDLARAHRLLGITKHHEGRKVIQPTWRGMCYVMLKLRGRETDVESIRRYQAERLGRFGGETLLCEMMPIPKLRVGSWEYEEAIPQFRSAEEYYRRVKPKRESLLRTVIQQNKPRVVVGYGKGYWEAYQRLFLERRFKRDGAFLVSGEEFPLVVLTPHFASRAMNHQWDKLVALMNRYIDAKVG